MLYDATIDKVNRKVVGHFGRNGFYYSIDRTNGRFMSGSPPRKMRLMLSSSRVSRNNSSTAAIAASRSMFFGALPKLPPWA